MKTVPILMMLAAALSVCPLVAAHAQEGEAAPEAAAEPLEPGDPAPALEIAEWIQHEPGQLGEPGRFTYVVTWATTAVDAAEALESVGRLQRWLAVDVIVLTTEDAGVVRDFVAAEAERSRWPVPIARDGGAHFVRHFAAREVPTSSWGYFVDAEGQIAARATDNWSAYVLERLLRGNWDIARGWEDVDSELIADLLRTRLPAAEASGDVEAQLAVLDELASLEYSRSALGVQRFRLLASDPDRLTEAYERVEQVAAEAMQGVVPLLDSTTLNGLAWEIATLEGLVYRDLALALELAQRSCALTDHADAAHLDTLARVHYERGDVAAALEWQRKAVAALADDRFLDEATREHCAQWLATYEAALGR